jgi:hypothetical protein
VYACLPAPPVKSRSLKRASGDDAGGHRAPERGANAGVEVSSSKPSDVARPTAAVADEGYGPAKRMKANHCRTMAVVARSASLGYCRNKEHGQSAPGSCRSFRRPGLPAWCRLRAGVDDGRLRCADPGAGRSTKQATVGFRGWHPESKIGRRFNSIGNDGASPYDGPVLARKQQATSPPKNVDWEKVTNWRG